ncbi:hypothetical protein [Fodinicurvata fenggangensis]|uniref:hypothetical protein n=1 Tax=Fodinicurvata fenggangensis TaxID=1121830 RepID=UPI00047EC547|nr:hypothetical protein [Fodinicurvata fenggangensis]
MSIQGTRIERRILEGEVHSVSSWADIANSCSDSPAGDALDAYFERVRPIVDDTIDKLSQSTFRQDPIAGRKYSRATSIISSAYKRHGQLLGTAIIERLHDSERLSVWEEEAFKLSHESLKQLQVHDRIEKCLKISLPYGDEERAIPLDCVVFDRDSKTLRSYNIKRGNGSYDAGKKRIITGELLRTNMLLKSYGETLGLDPDFAEAKIVFYYGVRSIPKPLSLVGEDLNDHFEFSVVDAVERVNLYFQERLYDIIEHG